MQVSDNKLAIDRHQLAKPFRSSKTLTQPIRQELAQAG